MKPDAVFLDIDDTLYDHKAGRIPAAHLEAVRRLQENGTKVFLCTGRALPLIDQLGLPDCFDGIVAGNGAFLYDGNRNLLYAAPIPDKSAAAVFSLARQEDICVFAAGNTVLVTKEDKHMAALRKHLSLGRFPIRAPEPGDTFSVISLVDGQYDKHRPDYEAIPDIQVFYNRISTDLCHAGTAKLEGARRLLEHFDLHAFAAFGDAMNDLELLLGADWGICMENGDARVKEAVPFVCPSVSEGGILTFCESAGWI